MRDVAITGILVLGEYGNEQKYLHRLDWHVRIFFPFFLEGREEGNKKSK